jgi:hypothetical protein
MLGLALRIVLIQARQKLRFFVPTRGFIANESKHDRQTSVASGR